MMAQGEQKSSGVEQYSSGLHRFWPHFGFPIVKLPETSNAPKSTNSTVITLGIFVHILAKMQQV